MVGQDPTRGEGDALHGEPAGNRDRKARGTPHLTTVVSPLTPREREIADLAAAGRTNREIAEQLVLSTRTIEAHLRNIYGKLDIRSRVELARAIQRTTAPISPPQR